MDRADLAEEGGAEQAKHAVGLEQGAEQAAGAARIVSAWRMILGEADGGVDLVRRGMDAERSADQSEGFAMEVGDAHRPQRQRSHPIRVRDGEGAVDQVETKLERPAGAVEWLRPQAAGVEMQGKVPAMVAPGQQRHGHLARDLAEQVQGGDGGPISLGAQLRPCRSIGHRPSPAAGVQTGGRFGYGPRHGK
jgi:hypothetical protein